MSNNLQEQYRNFISIIDKYEAEGIDCSDLPDEAHTGYLLLDIYASKYTLRKISTALYLHGVEKGMQIALNDNKANKNYGGL